LRNIGKTWASPAHISDAYASERIDELIRKRRRVHGF
jgi:hypothetical protein